MTNKEKFRKTLFGGGAKSSDGYIVYFNSSSSIEYVEDDNHLFVSAERLSGKQRMAIYPDELRKGSRDGDLIYDIIIRDKIVDRVFKIGNFLGWTLLL